MAKVKASTSGLAVMTTTAAVWLIYAGVRDVPVVDGLRDVLRGDVPAGKAKGVDVPERATSKAAAKGGIAVFDSSGPSGNIVGVAGITGGLDSSIARNVEQLLIAARADGIRLGGSGWRSRAAQVAARMKNGCPDVYNSPSSACRVPTARPGQSQHEKGLAIDFTQDGGSLKASGFAWLQAHAADYGLKNLPGERWHWSTTGK